MQLKVDSLEQTFDLAEKLTSLLLSYPCLTLTGGLGAGKTTFTKKIIYTLTGTPLDEIVSPTYTYVNIYKNKVAHFDLYRVNSLDALEELGLQEILLNPDIIKIIEWPQIAQTLLPLNKIEVTIDHLEADERLFTIKHPKVDCLV